MADYYPVLKRAISSLPSSSGEARRAVYEKARAALLKQLQSYDPPLSPAEITDQRLALEECIRRVESEVAGAAFGLPTTDPVAVRVRPPAPGSEPPREAKAEPKSEPKPEPRAEDTESRPVARAEPRPEPKPEPALAPPVATVPKPVPKPELRTPPPPPPPAADPEPAPDPKIGAGMSALARTLRQAETLGGASAQAVRQARDAIEEGPEEPGISEPPAAPKIEPAFSAAPTRPAPPAPKPAANAPGESAADAVPPPREVAVPRIEIGGPRPQSAGPVRPLKPKPVAASRRVPLRAVGTVAVVLLFAASGALVYTQRDRLFGGSTTAQIPAAGTAGDAQPDDGLEPKILDRLPQEGDATPVAPDAKPVSTERVTPPVDVAEAPPAPAAPDGGAVPAEPAPDQPGTGTEEPPAAAVTEPALPPATDTAPVPVEPAPGVPTETVPATPTPPAEAAGAPQSGEPVVLVAQRAILYEEPIPGSDGARVDGQVLWTYVNEPVLPGEPAVPQIRATIEVPDRGIKLSMSLRKNSDAALPASHIIELKFDLPADFAGRGIDTTPGLILKQTEDARGDPLIGAVAKVSDNLFWLALSGAGQDSTRNLALLRERQWVDVPIRYTNRRRAILTFEKGAPGDDAFAKAFQAWGS